MSLSDPVADMLTRIRNASRTGKKEVNIKASKICHGVADVLKSEGYINEFDSIDDGTGQGLLRIKLKYSVEGDPVISVINRTSKPGRRIYSQAGELPRVMGGLGIAVVSTNKGVLSDRKCRSENVGGEVICTVS